MPDVLSRDNATGRLRAPSDGMVVFAIDVGLASEAILGGNPPTRATTARDRTFLDLLGITKAKG